MQADYILHTPGLLPEELIHRDTGELAGLMDAPVLDQWFSRGEPVASPCSDRAYEHQLFELFGTPLPADTDPPVAALRHHRLNEGGAAPWCICADPVHVRVDINNAVLFDARNRIDDQVQQDEWIPGVRPLLEEEGLQLRDAGNGCWYLLADSHQEIRTHSLTAVQGQALGTLLPYGPDRSRWLRLLNEIQMTLSQSQPDNMPINSLWFWGGGRLPEASPPSFDRVWTDEACAADLGRYYGCGIGDLAEGAARIEPTGPAGRQLAVIHGLLDLGAGQGLDNWMQSIAGLHRDWLQPLHRALMKGIIDSVVLVDGTRAWRVDRRNQRRWWRRRRFFLATQHA